MTDLSNSLAAHREKAEAATGSKWLVHKELFIKSANSFIAQTIPNFPRSGDSDAAFIAANDPRTVAAFISVAEAAHELMFGVLGVSEIEAVEERLRAALDNLSSVLQPDPATKEKA